MSACISMESDINWSRAFFTQTEFVVDHALPSLVRLVSEKGQHPPQASLGTLVDVSKSFLAYSHRRRTKAYAQHLVWDPDSKCYAPDDLFIEIPKDYPGFFEIVPDDPRKIVTHHSSIQEVVAARCTQFLVKTLTGGFRTQETSNDKLEISCKHMVYPGEVLNVVKTVTKRWKLKENGRKNAESQYLQCIDSRGLEVCIPLIHPGIYCALYDDDVRSSNFVWTPDDLLTKFDFPVTVRLCFGWPPTLPQGHYFSGMLRLFEKRRPDTLVLYNLQENANVVIELPFDMKVKLQPAENYSKLKESEVFVEATEDSDSAVYFYAVSMKAIAPSYRNSLRNDVRVDTIGRAGAQLTKGFLANAKDMNLFSSQEYYPPINETNQESPWTITFTDTTAEIKETDVYFENDSDHEEKRRAPPDEKSKQALSRTKSLAGHSKTDALEKVSQDIRDPGCDNTRRSRIIDIDRRETHC